MKKLTGLTKALMACAFMLCMMVVLAVPASAADKIPTKARIWVKSVDSVNFDLPSNAYEVKDIKTSSTSLYARLTDLELHKDSSEAYVMDNKATIGLYAKKKGVYTLSFAIYDVDGNKISSHKVKVYAYDDSPLKKVTFNGKEIGAFITVTASGGKFKVTMNSGYKLKKIEVSKDEYKKDADGSVETETVWTKVKNGSKITLNKKPYYYISSYGTPKEDYYSYYYRRWMKAETEIRITYIDKYTKLTDTTTYYIDKIVK